MRVGTQSYVALAGLLASMGCAQGTSGGGDTGIGGGDTGGGDMGTPPRRDSSVSQPDSAMPPPTCMDEGHGSACERATDLGSLMEGDSVMADPGVLPILADEDWFRVDFPANPEMNTAGGGMPAIELVVNEGDAFRFEVRGTCTITLGCGDGMSARDVDSWSFIDDQSMEGDEQWSTRDAPWPEAAVIRVYRPVGMGDCQQYQIRVSR